MDLQAVEQRAVAAGLKTSRANLECSGPILRVEFEGATVTYFERSGSVLVTLTAIGTGPIDLVSSMRSAAQVVSNFVEAA